jgi:glycosyltransferase involved in cell wall biosynthesis
MPGTDGLIEQGPALRAALQPSKFLGWGGAADLMRMLLLGMTAMPNRFGDIYLLIANPSLSRRVKSIFKPPKPAKVFDRSLLADMGPDAARIKFETFDKTRLAQVLQERHIDFYLLPDSSPGPHFPRPWICYIYDFQHKHYPSFFSEAEIERRDNNYKTIFADSRLILTNSRNAADDAKLFYPAHTAKIFPLPFSPLLREAWLTYDTSAAKQQFGINEPYFLISNQFWVHKNHKVAFLALRKLLDKLSGDGICLVCTGSLDDYRRPDYIHSIRAMLAELDLSPRVRLLGHIPKHDQIALLRGAKAVIQPTLFEGGPVGGSGYEAIALGVPLIASDIKVNREAENESHVHFFDPDDADGLASLMHSALKQEANPSAVELISKSNMRRERLGHFLWQMGQRARNEFASKLAEI